MFTNIYQAIISKKSLILFLLFSGLFFNPLPIIINSIKLVYAFIFVTWSMIILYLIFLRKEAHYILILSIAVVVPSIILGILLLDNKMTNVLDYWADCTRFVAPFIGYFATVMLLEKVSHKIILKLFLLLFIYEIYKLLSSVIYKAIDYFLYSSPLIKYNGLGLESSIILFTILLFYYYFRKKNFVLFLLVYLALFSLILHPIITVSRTNTILISFQLLVIIFIFICHIKATVNKFIIVSIIFLLITTFLNYIKDSDVVSRINNAAFTAMGISQSKMMMDASTNVRVGEIQGVLDNLNGSLFNIIFGMGSGAWISGFHVDKHKEVNRGFITGLGSRNYRGEGKYIHHVHSGIFAILNRNGVIGVLFYLYFLYFLFKLSKRLVKNGVREFRYYNNNEYFVYLYGLGSTMYVFWGFISIFPSMGFYGSIFWGSKVAMISVAIKFLQTTHFRIPEVIK